MKMKIVALFSFLLVRRWPMGNSYENVGRFGKSPGRFTKSSYRFSSLLVCAKGPWGTPEKISCEWRVCGWRVNAHSPTRPLPSHTLKRRPGREIGLPPELALQGSQEGQYHVFTPMGCGYLHGYRQTGTALLHHPRRLLRFFATVRAV